MRLTLQCRANTQSVDTHPFTLLSRLLTCQNIISSFRFPDMTSPPQPVTLVYVGAMQMPTKQKQKKHRIKAPVPRLSRRRRTCAAPASPKDQTKGRAPPRLIRDAASSFAPAAALGIILVDSRTLCPLDPVSSRRLLPKHQPTANRDSAARRGDSQPRIPKFPLTGCLYPASSCLGSAQVGSSPPTCLSSVPSTKHTRRPASPAACQSCCSVQTSC